MLEAATTATTERVGSQVNAAIVHRYYDPNTGRYLSEDPLRTTPRVGGTIASRVLKIAELLGEANLGADWPEVRSLLRRLDAESSYAYARDNPLSNTDDSGLRTRPKLPNKPKRPGPPDQDTVDSCKVRNAFVFASCMSVWAAACDPIPGLTTCSNRDCYKRVWEFCVKQYRENVKVCVAGFPKSGSGRGSP